MLRIAWTEHMHSEKALRKIVRAKDWILTIRKRHERNDERGSGKFNTPWTYLGQKKQEEISCSLINEFE